MTFVEILSLFVTFLLTAVSAIFVRFLKSKISDNAWKSIEFWVNSAVNAAEQVYKMQENAGEEKRAYVFESLDALNLNLCETEKNILVEAAVSHLLDTKKT